MKNTPLLILLAVAAVVAIAAVTYSMLRGHTPPPGINDPRTELKEFIPSMR